MSATRLPRSNVLSPVPKWYVLACLGFFGQLAAGSAGQIAYAIDGYASPVLGPVFSLIFAVFGIVILAHQMIFWHRYSSNSQLWKRELWLIGAGALGTLAVAIGGDISGAAEYGTYDRMSFALDFEIAGLVIATLAVLLAFGNYIYLIRLQASNSGLARAFKIIGFIFYCIFWIALTGIWGLVFMFQNAAHDPSSE